MLYKHLLARFFSSKHSHCNNKQTNSVSYLIDDQEKNLYINILQQIKIQQQEFQKHLSLQATDIHNATINWIEQNSLAHRKTIEDRILHLEKLLLHIHEQLSLQIMDIHAASMASQKQIAATYKDILECHLQSIEDSLFDLAERPQPCSELNSGPLYHYIKTIHKLTKIQDVKDGTLIRLGSAHDGGYVMLDELNLIQKVYSIGIDHEISWDMEIAKRGIPCYMYDPFIDSLTESHPLFHWKKQGVCGPENDNPQFSTLEALLKHNMHIGHKDLILKMDIEGAEWDILKHMTPEILEHFSQIILELHDLHNLELSDTITRSLQNLLLTHQPVHLHGNNFMPSLHINELVLPRVLEILYIRKSDHEFISSSHFYPRKIEAPNNPNRNDIILGIWNSK